MVDTLDEMTLSQSKLLEDEIRVSIRDIDGYIWLCFDRILTNFSLTANIFPRKSPSPESPVSLPRSGFFVMAAPAALLHLEPCTPAQSRRKIQGTLSNLT
jgi:hypothetical protein